MTDRDPTMMNVLFRQDRTYQRSRQRTNPNPTATLMLLLGTLLQLSLWSSQRSSCDGFTVVPSRRSSSPDTALRAARVPKDVLVVGGGLAGLSVALELATKRGRHVTVLEKDVATNTGSFAAAGMLAPQSERLPTGPLLDLCLASRHQYAEFVRHVEALAKDSGSAGRRYLSSGDDAVDGLEPWEVGFRATGGFLAPAFAGDSVATWAPPQGTGVSYWLDEIQVHELEPHLHPDVIGGWWFPEDASVDARRLTCSLRAACVTAGVQILMGPETAAASLELSGGHCNGVHLADGRIFAAKSIVVANGSWMRELLPVPITPHKGQSFSLRMDDKSSSPLLSRVLFAQDTYIVPKADGRIVIGATVEPGSFDPNVTPAGMMHCMSSAIALVPALAHLPLEETWAGLRPTTPDKAPIIGETAWDNLYIAGGYWRNGVLLAPKTAQLLGDLISDEVQMSEDDKLLLQEFAWDRFTSPEGGAKMAANSRFASSMHPVHGRASGVGISAAVGTELGFYSSARAAGAERKRDREALEGGNDMEAFERAAFLGKKDGSAFTFVKPDYEDEEVTVEEANVEDVVNVVEELHSTANGATNNDESTEGEGLYDGYTMIQEANGALDRRDELEVMRAARVQNRIGTTKIDEAQIDAQREEEDVDEVDSNELPSLDSSSDDLSSMYETIRANKAAKDAYEMGEKATDERPDPGFRIYHVDHETGNEILVPPYTRPEVMQELIYQDYSDGNNSEQGEKVFAESDTEKPNGEDTTPSEEIYDGYSEILEANGDSSRDVELEAMRLARMSNRAGYGTPINEDDI